MNTASTRRRGLSVRAKLALSYAGFLIVAGVALFAVGFLLLRFVPDGSIMVPGGGWAPNRSNLLEVFIRYAWWAMGLLAAFGLIGGWILAGLVLRPLGKITTVAVQARDGRLDDRVELPGRGNELTDLADTLDAMLDRVEHTIAEERRFAANASHELRTPHAIVRTMVEVAQADPGGRDVDLLLQRIATTNDRAIATTESLLTLARIGRGTALDTETFDLAELVASVVDEARVDASARGIHIDTWLTPTPVTANRQLIAQLVTNLVGNAVVHNAADPSSSGVGIGSGTDSDTGPVSIVGARWVRIAVTTNAARPELLIANSGAVLEDNLVATLTEPFVRGAGRARGHAAPGTTPHTGAGLGLAIVASIVQAHEGDLDVLARPDGGLQVRVTLAG